MTYIQLINRFWDFYRVKKFSDIDTAIYFFLLNECNIRRWLNPFELQTRNIEICFSISRKTIGEARNRLKQRGLIDFIEAQGRGPTIYFISEVEVTNTLLYESFCVSDCVSRKKHKGNTNGNTKVTQRLHKGNTTSNSTLYIEEERYKTKEKDNTTSGDVVAPPPPPVSESLFAEEEKKASKRKPKSTKAPPPAPPTLEEVLQYFLQENADTRLQNWERSAMLFYDTYNADGWLNKYGRRITNWESEANKWMFYREEKEKKRNETNQTDRLSERRGAEPKYDGSENFDGPF